MVINYVLIDYENVQPPSLMGLEAEHFRVLFLFGVQQKSVALDTAVAIKRFGPRAEIVQMAGQGNNALDFHIAFYIGRLTVLDPSAHFHIISRDTGFDPLVKHLRERKIQVARHNALADIPLLRQTDAKQTDERIALIVADLRRRGTATPRTCKALANTIRTMFRNQLTDDDAQKLVHALQAKRLIKVNQAKVTYALPADGELARPTTQSA